MSDIEIIEVHDPADCDQAEAEIRRLREQLRIAVEALEWIAKHSDDDAPWVWADDALTQMSVVE